ncbi:hypothetical protein CDD80_3337 [Ophiocordyceps camponoti-rufipedis]|uniref:Uncharacterized protein n=1 Tax=Ophiocordyceps camponoti-rufipedis TaxID=2004952 RepID=A0A2C5YWW6_9HYPO|nr:hypothetical protein CDD80_3337 [Ophiocordyceps camponoti-rufipedis]
MRFFTLIALFIVGAVALPTENSASTIKDEPRIMAKRDLYEDLGRWSRMRTSERRKTLAHFHDLIRGTSDHERHDLCSNDTLTCSCASDDTECRKGATGLNKDQQIALYFMNRFLDCREMIENSKGTEDLWLWSNMKCRNRSV